MLLHGLGVNADVGSLSKLCLKATLDSCCYTMSLVQGQIAIHTNMNLNSIHATYTASTQMMRRANSLNREYYLFYPLLYLCR